MERRLRLHVLASGSRGNAALIEDATTGRSVLVDCGICKRDFLDRCDQAGVNPCAIAAVFVTHDHTDHTKGLGVVTRGLARLGVTPPVYALPEVLAASRELRELQDALELRSLALGEAVEAAGLRVTPFATSHDAADSCGFRFECGEDALGYLTDSGHVTAQAREALAGVRILALESNHDAEMLRTGPYPYPIKRRVGSEHGHLSNDQACEELERLLALDEGAQLEHVIAMHISQNNNEYRLPREAFEAVVKASGRDVAVSVAYQNRLVSVR